LKRGTPITIESDPDVRANMMFRFKDDGEHWSNNRSIELGRLGDFRQEVDIHRNGIFKTRKYEITIVDKVPFIMYDAEEDIELIG